MQSDYNGNWSSQDLRLASANLYIRQAWRPLTQRGSAVAATLNELADSNKKIDSRLVPATTDRQILISVCIAQVPLFEALYYFSKNFQNAYYATTRSFWIDLNGKMSVVSMAKAGRYNDSRVAKIYAQVWSERKLTSHAMLEYRRNYGLYWRKERVT